MSEDDERLVRRLRYLSSVEFAGTAAGVACETMGKAADRIEALQRECDEWETRYETKSDFT